MESHERKLLQDTAERIIDRQENEGFDALPNDERIFFLVWIADPEVGNGGMHAICYNSTGTYLSQIPNAFRAIGAPRKAACFDSLIRILSPGTISPDSILLIAQYETISNEASNQIEALNEIYFAIPEEVMPLLLSWCLPWAGDRLRGRPKTPQSPIVDNIAMSSNGAECELSLIESEKWDIDGKRMFQLQDRIHKSVNFVSNGDLKRQRPDSNGKRVKIVVDAKYPLGQLEEQMIAAIRSQWCEPKGIELTVKSIGQENGT